MSPDPLLEELVRRTEGLQPWRRALHTVGGSCLALVVYSLGAHGSSTRWLFGIMLAIALGGDLLRLRSTRVNTFVFSTFAALMCPREVGRPSLTWFLLGVNAVLWIPVADAAVPSLLVLSLADPAASIVGRSWGRHPFGKGTAEGTLTFFAVAVLVLFPFVGGPIALPVATLAAVVEALPTPLDDNTLIPLVTAAGLWATSVVM